MSFYEDFKEKSKNFVEKHNLFVKQYPIGNSFILRDGYLGEIHLEGSYCSWDIKIPFNNMLELIKHFLNLAYTSDMEELAYFLIADDEKNLQKKIYSSLPLYQCLIEATKWNSFFPRFSKFWMKFDKNELETLLKDSFFDDYHTLIKRNKNFPKKHREYPLLELYSFIKLQSLAAQKLPAELTLDMQWIWKNLDLMRDLNHLGFYETIADVYKTLGMEWFKDRGKNDPIMYEWTCMAINACIITKNIPYNELKKDLNNLYSELLIIFTINDTIKANQDIINMVVDSLSDIENSSLDVLAQKIRSLEKENAHLKVENYKLKEGYELLKDQVTILQKDSEQSDDAKVETISHRINSLFPKSVGDNADIAQFPSIFNSLKPSTQQDLKSAVSLIDNFQEYDLALLQLTRSVEREFIVNFIIPFQESKFYYGIKDPYCDKKRYMITHKILMVGNKPTMGNIPFIGRAVLDSKAMKASNVIEAFSIFLDDNREPFATICKDLGNYEIGLKNFKLVDIRNGIAHGDDNVTGDIDQDTYEQVNKMLFEPPMQILSNIIKYSMKKT